MESGLISPNSILKIAVPEEATPIRIDTFLGNYFEAYSRSFFQKFIEKKRIKINNNIADKPSISVKAGDVIEVHFPPQVEIYPKKKLPALDVEIIYEHPHFLIVRKPAGLLVHVPAVGHEEVTLVDWLINHFNEIRKVGAEDRPGIVHRLDKDTSGLLIIPRNNYAHKIFNDMFKNRTIKKTYIALVEGHPAQEGVIDYPIGRNLTNPTKMTHKNKAGRDSTTHYKVLEYFSDTSLLELKPITGRTHQLRVHCAAIGHPIVGDPIYGSKSKLINRQALHAEKLEFKFLKEPFSFSAKIPEDLKRLIKAAKNSNVR